MNKLKIVVAAKSKAVITFIAGEEDTTLHIFSEPMTEILNFIHTVDFPIVKPQDKELEMNDIKIAVTATSKNSILFIAKSEHAAQLEQFGKVVYLNLNGYVLYITTGTKEEVVKFIQLLNFPELKNQKPPIKRRIAPYYVLPACWQFNFDALPEDAQLLKEFGEVRSQNTPNSYVFRLDQRYDFQDVLDYIDRLNGELTNG